MLSLTLPLGPTILVFLAAAAIIGVAGVKAAALADQLADRTGLGEALTGTIFLGLLTALPGLAASMVAAWQGHAALAISNAIGGIAVQTIALAVADISFPKANLEHAAASAANMMQTGMLVALMVLALAGLSGPDVTLGHVHPITPLLFLTAGAAFWLVLQTEARPMWKPTQTKETVEDIPDKAHQFLSLRWLLVGLICSALATAISGAVVAAAAENIVRKTGLPETVVGGLFMALATSLPELVTSVAAVRRGALTLAVSDVVGGNFFDILFVAAADLVYLQGSLYHAAGVGMREVFLTAITILLNVVLLVGLIYRQRQGPGNIGFESLAMLIIYLVGLVVLSTLM